MSSSRSGLAVGLPRLRIEIIANKYGVIESAGDTIGPLGVFFGLRNVPVIMDICRDMQQICRMHCSSITTNPLAIIGWSVNDYHLH